MSNIVYTQEQEDALQAGASLQFKDANSSIVIKGRAGTGKSTLLAGLPKRIEQVANTYHLIDPSYKPAPVIFTGTTHKAVHNIKTITGFSGQTIHSLIGLRLSKDYSTGKTKLVRKMAAPKITDSIIVIDEASYLDSELISQIYKYTENCKFIFIGDPCQLTPVGHNYSPIFDMGIETHTLSKIQRQGEDTALQFVCEELAQFVLTGKAPKLNIDGVEILKVDSDEFIRLIEEDYPEWKNREYSGKILAWTNKKVEEYNQFFRKKFGGKPSFNPGDFAVCNATFTNKDICVTNNEEVTIDKLTPGSMHNKPGNFLKLRDHPNSKIFLPDNYAHYAEVQKQLLADNDIAGLVELDNTWIDLRSEFASTVNKAQGSTYDTAFIDLSDIAKCNNKDLLKRMLYVAASRAKTRIVFTGDIAK